MGAAKKVIEDQAKREKFVQDLVWYTKSLNQAVNEFINQMNSINAILNAEIESLKEGKQAS